MDDEENKIETEVAKYVVDTSTTSSIDSVDLPKEQEQEVLVRKRKKKGRKALGSIRKFIIGSSREAVDEDEFEEEEVEDELADKNELQSMVLSEQNAATVAENVDPESGWLKVDKSHIIDVLESQGDAPQLKKMVEKHASKLMAVRLLCKKGGLVTWLVALTEEAYRTAEAQEAEQRRIAEQLASGTVQISANEWKSLGSENEVTHACSTSSRPLIKLEIEANPEKMARAQNLTETKINFVSMGPGRHEFKGVRRMRIDAQIQAVPELHSVNVQTDPGLPVNAWTQYVYDLAEATSKTATRDLPTDYKFSELSYMENALEYNETLNLYTNDYPRLLLREEDARVPIPDRLTADDSFVDVQHCKNKVVSSMHWHPLWAGIVAVSYVYSTKSLAPAYEPSSEEFERHSVLVWSMQDPLLPRLILLAPRAVHSVKWCPVDGNILIGGMDGGQVVVWDITGKFEEIDKKEVLTRDQQRFRVAIRSLIAWSRPLDDKKYVAPVAVSSNLHSHEGTIFETYWLSPHHKLRPDGKFYPVEDGQFSLQFLTCGFDGGIFFWDLQSPDDSSKKNLGEPRFKSLDREMRPIFKLYSKNNNIMFSTCAAQNISVTYVREESAPLEEELLAKKPLEATFGDNKEDKNIEDGICDGKVVERKQSEERLSAEKKLDNASSQRDQIFEETEDEEEEKDSNEPDMGERVLLPGNERSFPPKFRALKKKQKEVPTSEIFIGSEGGELLHLHWEGLDYDKGEEIPTEVCDSLGQCEGIHDGPVVDATRSIFVPTIVMTVGGFVFALWSDKLRGCPIFWKSRPSRLIGGSWSKDRASCFRLLRMDGIVEIWDILLRSDRPILVQTISGDPLTAADSQLHPFPNNERRISFGNNYQGVIVFVIPEVFKTQGSRDLEEFKRWADKEADLKTRYFQWNMKYSAENKDAIRRRKELAAASTLTGEESRTQPAEVTGKKEEKPQARKKNRFRTMAEQTSKKEQEDQDIMLDILMRQKNLDKEELMKKQQPLLLIRKMDEERKLKQQKKLKEQEDQYWLTMTRLFPDVVDLTTEIQSEEKLMMEEVVNLVNQEMDSYDDLSQNVMLHLKNGVNTKKFDFRLEMEETTRRRALLDVPLFMDKARETRYEQKRRERLVHPPPPPQQFTRFVKTPSLALSNEMSFDREPLTRHLESGMEESEEE